MTFSNTKTELYKICTRCIMDTSDPQISFNSEGVCNHCREFDETTRKGWFPNEEGANRLKNIIDQIKIDGKNKEYNCIIGLSGGADSSYMALKVHEWGLRPLVVHVDGGWNSELAVANIEKIVKHCGYHLHTHVVDWEEMRDLQLAYLRAGVANQDVPQDHVIFASMYHFTIKYKLRYILSGGNIASESIFPSGWLIDAMDAINLKAIHRKYGERPLNTFNTISFFEYYIWYPFVKKMRTVRPLNFMLYNKKSAIEELSRTIGWRDYGRKHGESLFTKFYQSYYLPIKFGYDKRRPHLSSLIVSGQMTRDEAIQKLEEPLYNTRELESDIGYFCKKMCISRKQFDEFMTAPIHHYSEFSNGDSIRQLIKKIQTFVERSLGRNIRVYS
jgi:aminotransferase